MFLDLNNNIITQIWIAITMSANGGTPIHKNRPSHGLAFHVGVSATFEFDDGTVLELHDGDCIYLPKGSNYVVTKKSANNKSNAFCYAINFQLSEDTVCPPQIFHVRGKNEMESLFQKASKSWKTKDPGYMEDCFARLYSIIKILKLENSTYLPKKTINLLAPAIEYIKNNFTNENIKISTLASLCNISEVHFRRLFSLSFSESPAVYIRNLRLRHAKDLLDSGEYSVTDSAFMSGFNDVAYFSREFKKAMGIQPSAQVNQK